MTNEQLLTIIFSLGGLILTVSLALAGLILAQSRAIRSETMRDLRAEQRTESSGTVAGTASKSAWPRSRRHPQTVLRVFFVGSGRGIISLDGLRN